MSRLRKRRAVSRNSNLLMAVLIVGGGSLLLLLGALAILGEGRLGRAAIEVNGQPRVKIDKEVVDLGDIRLGRTVEASFVVSNVGDQPLSLTRVPYVEVVEGC